MTTTRKEPRKAPQSATRRPRKRPTGGALHWNYGPPPPERTVEIGDIAPDDQLGWHTDERGRTVYRTNWHNKYWVYQPDYRPDAKPVVVTVKMAPETTPN